MTMRKINEILLYRKFSKLLMEIGLTKEFKNKSLYKPKTSIDGNHYPIKITKRKCKKLSHLKFRY